METRRRNLNFYTPLIIPLAPQIRLVQDDRSNVTLQEVYEHHAAKSGFHKDDPIILFTERLRDACRTEDLTSKTVYYY